MPIRPELRHFYGRDWREVIRPRILARACDKCEQCGKPNRLKVWVYSVPGDQYWTALKGQGQRWHYCAIGGSGNFALFGEQWKAARQIRVVLTIAHLNHAAGDDRDENLKALCQWCHLNLDKLQHKETRSIRKDAARPLLREASGA